MAEGADPLNISKNLAEIKSIKVSNKNPDRLVLGADSVISLNNELINKPKSRRMLLIFLKIKQLYTLFDKFSLSKNGSMIWNYTDTSELKMKNHSEDQLLSYLNKIATETLLAYGVYQVEADGLDLFGSIKGQNSIMGLPIKNRNILQIIKMTKKFGIIGNQLSILFLLLCATTGFPSIKLTQNIQL